VSKGNTPAAGERSARDTTDRSNAAASRQAAATRCRVPEVDAEEGRRRQHLRGGSDSRHQGTRTTPDAEASEGETGGLGLNVLLVFDRRRQRTFLRRIRHEQGLEALASLRGTKEVDKWPRQ
jgi:hypothetical protein